MEISANSQLLLPGSKDSSKNKLLFPGPKSNLQNWHLK